MVWEQITARQEREAKANRTQKKEGWHGRQQINVKNVPGVGWQVAKEEKSAGWKVQFSSPGAGKVFTNHHKNNTMN